MGFGPAQRRRRSQPTLDSRDARSPQRSAQTRVRTAPAVRADFQEACADAGISTQEALEAFMVRAEAYGWLDVISRLHTRQAELDTDEMEEDLTKAG